MLFIDYTYFHNWSPDTCELENEQQPARKKSRLLGNLDFDSEEVQNLLKKRSKHDRQLSEVSCLYSSYRGFKLKYNLF